MHFFALWQNVNFVFSKIRRKIPATQKFSKWWYHPPSLEKYGSERNEKKFSDVSFCLDTQSDDASHSKINYLNSSLADNAKCSSNRCANCVKEEKRPCRDKKFQSGVFLRIQISDRKGGNTWL
jgi:hypothetical protein